MSLPDNTYPKNRIVLFPYGFLHEHNEQPHLRIHPKLGLTVQPEDLFWLDLLGTAPTLQLLTNHCKDLGYSETQVEEKLKDLHNRHLFFYVKTQGGYNTIIPELENFYPYLTEPPIGFDGGLKFGMPTANIISPVTDTPYEVLDFTRHLVADFDPNVKLGFRAYYAMTELKNSDATKLNSLIQSENWDMFWQQLVKDLQALVRNKAIYIGTAQTSSKSC